MEPDVENAFNARSGVKRGVTKAAIVAVIPMARLELTLLGGFQARLVPGGPVNIPTRKARALLAYLALPAGKPHARDQLAALLWGDVPDAQSRGSLRKALFWLRQAVGDTVTADAETA